MESHDGAMSSNSDRIQLIRAPSRATIANSYSIFLAGTISAPAPAADWRALLCAALAREADADVRAQVTVLDPVVRNWAAAFPTEAAASTAFRTQVEWELDMAERADLVVVYFGAETDAPVSLLELGLCLGRRGHEKARKGVLVACHARYRKRGNVEVVCARYGVDVVDADGEDEKALCAVVLKKLAEREKS